METPGVISQYQNQVYLQKPRESDNIYYVGHGRLEKSPSSTSIMHVISHELDHVAEFKAKAIRDHAEIRSLDVKIDYEFRNGKIVAVGGKTTVTTEPSKETSKRSIPALPQEFDDVSFIKKAELPNEDLTIQASKLKDKLKQIESEIDESLRRSFYTNPNFKTATDLKDDERERELRETKTRIHVQLEELQNKNLLEKSKSIIGKIIHLQNNFKESLVKLGLIQGKGSRLDTVA